MAYGGKEAGTTKPIRRRTGLDFDEFGGVNLERDPSAIGPDQLQRGLNVRRVGGRLVNRGGQQVVTGTALTGCPVGIIEANAGGEDAWLMIPGKVAGGNASLMFFNSDASTPAQEMIDGELRSSVLSASRWDGPEKLEDDLGDEDDEEPGSKVYVGLSAEATGQVRASYFIGSMRILPKQEIPLAGGTFADDGQRTLPKAVRPQSQNGGATSGELSALEPLAGDLAAGYGNIAASLAAEVALFQRNKWVVDYTDPTVFGGGEVPGRVVLHEHHEELFMGFRGGQVAAPGGLYHGTDAYPGDVGRNTILRRKHSGEWVSTAMPTSSDPQLLFDLVGFSVCDFASYDNRLFCCGFEDVGIAGALGAVLEWDPSTESWGVLAVLSGGLNTEPVQITALTVFNGLMFWITRETTGTDNPISIGSYDGSSVTYFEKSLYGDHGTPGMHTSDHIDYAGLVGWRGSLRAVFHWQDGPVVASSPGTDTDGDWTFTSLPREGVAGNRSPMVPM